MSGTQALDPLRLPLAGTQLIEASAGTGKTWTIAALYLRLVLGHGGGAPLLPAQILVMTFTKAATAELRERIRTRLAEAAEAFRGKRTPDDFLTTLIADYPDAGQRARAARQLELAAQWMDEAAVFTIHGWCQRMLGQHAFASGEASASDEVTDDAELLAEAVRDYWRGHVFTLGRAAAAVFLGAWKTPADLQKVLAPLLPHADHLQLGGQPLPAPHEPKDLLDAPAGALHEAEAAARQTWLAAVDAIEAMLLTASETKVLKGNLVVPKNLPGHLATMRAWAQGNELDDDTLARFTQPRLIECTAKDRQAPSHPAFAALEHLQACRAETLALPPLLLAHAAPWVAQHMDEARRRLAQLGYDDMLKRLDAALHGAAGDALARLIATQYPVALVDEFQDTDPLQWRILQRCYVDVEGKALLLIGDPKQAIYGFRGADIHTYLAARGQASEPHWTLGTNHRSTAALVEAINRVFLFADRYDDGAFGFGKALPFIAVGAKGRKEQLQLDGETLPAMPMAVQTSASTLGSGAWRKTMAEHAAAQLVAWLGAAQQGRCGFADGHGQLTPLQPGDIAILVRDRHDAAAMRMALHARGLAHVYLSDNQSVYASAEAAELLAWLAACAQPGNDRAMRAALATPSMGQSLAELERLNTDEAHWETCGEHFRQLHALWQRHGVLAMLHELLHRFGVPARLLVRVDGERALTNLLHLAELLQQAASGLDGEHALIRHLAAQIANPAGGEAAEEQIVRLESEAALIKIVTIHKSKGLEYPVVLLPFVCGFRETSDKKPLLWHDARGVAHFDLRPDIEAWEQAEVERRQEDLRLLYVALTRARHLCWLGVACLKNGGGKASELHKSAFGYVLAGGQSIEPAELRARVDELAQGQPAIHVANLPEQADTQHYRPQGNAIQPRDARRCTLPPYAPWWIASYSALAHSDDASTPRHAPETADQSTLTENVAAANAEAGGMDAHGIHAFPRGANAGTFLHDLLESCADEGFARAAAPSAGLRDTIARRCQARGWQLWIKPLTEWLPALLRTPLPLPDGDAMALAALTDTTRYRAELEFWFEANHVDAAALDRLVSAHTLDGAARPALPPNRVNGMLKGFIDLVFEHAGRWYVADYKSNWLGAHAGAYTDTAMRDSVLQSRYDLQYAIYTLALHRQLKARLPGYEYERDMGGVLYLYLRGVDGEGHGVHCERLPFALVDALDRLFAEGGDGHARS
ncbi:exodeoxyribonuclease V subunit beta [Rhodanobacter sp. DHB23]|uniref:exodeoxyribonuclease V subunit beta n=1 Tax=Rhodanobacter sp. DHB23 TaxID=2775923 RepID=UPI00177F704B|nr:exodeoxyribonuclease V subunit beta [Rhodanobacter sp. DHB23]MBD8872871.1 exodeoxyribonuclease V subunit beta [Rhodanobacter sp. DHB23]